MNEMPWDEMPEVQPPLRDVPDPDWDDREWRERGGLWIIRRDHDSDDFYIEQQPTPGLLH